MSIETNTEFKSGYIQITSKGTYEFPAVLEVFKNAINLSEERNIQYLLLDLRGITGDPPSTLDRYDLGQHVATLQRATNIRTKIAVVGNEPMIDPERLGETVALNRGGTGKVFTNLDQATIWLKEQIEDSQK